jgi:hypothetical protein
MKELNSMFVETSGGGTEVTFVEKTSTMTKINSNDFPDAGNDPNLEIEPAHYVAVAYELAVAVGESEFFSGSICCSHEGFDSTLTATILVYRRPEQLPEGTVSVIYDIVPVWWEFTTVAPDGSELINDFCFGEFKKYFFAPEPI